MVCLQGPFVSIHEKTQRQEYRASTCKPLRFAGAYPVEILPVGGVQSVIAPGVEDVLAVAVEGQVQLHIQ